MSNKKIIIMTASIGHGHNKVALATKESLLKENKNLDIKIVDFIKVIESLFDQLILSAYFKIIDTFPSWYHYIYSITSKMSKDGKVKDLFAHRYKKKILNIIEDFKPDAIIFTNPFILTIVGYLKKIGKINTYTAAIITDYSAHNIWLNPYINKYFVASKELRKELINKGITEEKIIVSGIPIHKKFYDECNIDQIISKLDIEKKLPTLLVMGGGMGVGAIEEVLDNINLIKESLQIIVVTGTNKALKEKIENKLDKYRHKIRVLGFVDNIHELMHCSDLLISKSGGVTVTEAITKKLPMLIADPIPGQELENADYLTKAGLGILINDISEVRDKVQELLFENSTVYKEIKSKLNDINIINSNEIIAKTILNDTKTYKRTSAM